MSANIKNFMNVLTGNRDKPPLSQELSAISESNAIIMQGLLELADRLERENRIAEAKELRQEIKYLLANNQKLIDTASQALVYAY